MGAEQGVQISKLIDTSAERISRAFQAGESDDPRDSEFVDLLEQIRAALAENPG